jgi:hypothetical protein
MVSIPHLALLPARAEVEGGTERSPVQRAALEVVVAHCQVLLAEQETLRQHLHLKAITAALVLVAHHMVAVVEEAHLLLVKLLPVTVGTEETGLLLAFLGRLLLMPEVAAALQIPRGLLERVAQAAAAMVALALVVLMEALT